MHHVSQIVRETQADGRSDALIEQRLPCMLPKRSGTMYGQNRVRKASVS